MAPAPVCHAWCVPEECLRWWWVQPSVATALRSCGLSAVRPASSHPLLPRSLFTGRPYSVLGDGKAFGRCYTDSVIPLKGGWKKEVVAESILQKRRKGNLCKMSSPGGSGGKESACNAGDLGWISGLGRSPGGGNGPPLQYSCLGHPLVGGAWQAPVHGVAKSQT